MQQLLEIIRTAHQALFRNWGRAILTSLSMVIGTASLVLVVVAGVNGRAYTLKLIQGVGTNLIMISNESSTVPDKIRLGDMRAIQTEVPGVQAAAPVITSAPIVTLDGVSRRVTMLGTTPDYQQVRSIQVLSGRFFDSDDQRFRDKVCLVTQSFADKLHRDPFYRGYVTLHGLQFSVIGVFRERVDTYGTTEVTDYSVLAPISVVRYFKPDDTLDYLYVSAEDMTVVPTATAEIRRLLIRRHHNHSYYQVVNLAGILNAANKISLGLTVVLLVIAAISLIASGVSIMNVMLITVTERTREIGIKKAIGAYRRVLLTEFLVEALMLSIGGGFVGVVLGVAVPYSIRFFTSAIQIRIPFLAIVFGFGVTLIVGLTFGMIPALRASRMNPVEALRYE